jgi:hypothetical protein
MEKIFAVLDRRDPSAEGGPAGAVVPFKSRAGVADGLIISAIYPGRGRHIQWPAAVAVDLTQLLRQISGALVLDVPRYQAADHVIVRLGARVECHDKRSCWAVCKPVSRGQLAEKTLMRGVVRDLGTHSRLGTAIHSASR